MHLIVPSNITTFLRSLPLLEDPPAARGEKKRTGGLLVCYLLPLFFLLPTCVHSVPEEPMAKQEVTTGEVADPYAELEVYLITAMVGKPVAERFGHTMLRVKDRKAGWDVMINWGVYDAGDPLFLYRFVKGNMIYHTGVTATSDVLLQFNHPHHDRRLLEEKLHLTPRQKQRLMQKLRHNLQPENTSFPYHYFYNNCSTKVRDLLDDLLDGNLYKKFSKEATGQTWREVVWRHLAADPLAAWIVEILMNSNVDRPMSRWDAMFSPLELRETLLKLPAYAEDGQPQQEISLLSASRVLAPSSSLGLPEKASPPTALYHLLLWSLLCLLTSGVALYLLQRWGWKVRRFTLMASIARKMGSWLYLLWGLPAGVLGVLMTLGWVWSEHLDLQHSASLFFFWPTDFIWSAFGIYGMSCRRTPLHRVCRVGVMGYALLHMGSFVLFYLLYGCGVITQSMERLLSWWALPSLLLFTSLPLMLWLQDQQKGKESNAMLPSPHSPAETAPSTP